MPVRGLALLLALAAASPVRAGTPSVADYPSIQAGLDANPGRMLLVPAGDHPITEPIRIRGERSGLCGPGRIIQQSSDRPIVVVEGAVDAEVRGLTLTRPDGGSIVAHNIVSDFGHGRAAWVWGDDNALFRFDGGQHPDDPPLTDVLVTGNLLHHVGPPRYAHAVVIHPGATGPRGMHFSGNRFPPGTRGVCNQDLPP